MIWQIFVGWTVSLNPRECSSRSNADWEEHSIYLHLHCREVTLKDSHFTLQFFSLSGAKRLIKALYGGDRWRYCSAGIEAQRTFDNLCKNLHPWVWSFKISLTSLQFRLISPQCLLSACWCAARMFSFSDWTYKGIWSEFNPQESWGFPLSYKPAAIKSNQLQRIRLKNTGYK